MLENLSYEGERCSFTFEKFIERHMEGYLELARHNEPVLESKKVRDFLNRIKAPELSAAKQQVRATANLSASFEDAVNFISLNVTPLKQSQRNVASIDSNPTGRGFRGRGRGRGRGRTTARGSGHGGRVNAGGRDQSPGRGGNRHPPFTGYYTADEW